MDSITDDPRPSNLVRVAARLSREQAKMIPQEVANNRPSLFRARARS